MKEELLFYMEQLGMYVLSEEVIFKQEPTNLRNHLFQVLRAFLYSQASVVSH